MFYLNLDYSLSYLIKKTTRFYSLVFDYYLIVLKIWGYGGIGRRNGLKGTISIILSLEKETFQVNALKFRETFT